MGQDRPRYRRIVVGVDGSPVSRDALRWAADEAVLRDCDLEVVYGWQVSTEPRPPGEEHGVAPPLEAYQRQAEERIVAVVAETLGAEARLGADADKRITVKAVHRTPGRALIEEAAEADLLVLGSKGRGRLAGWLLGSISDEAVQRAPCSVVIVRPRREPEATDQTAKRGAAFAPRREPEATDQTAKRGAAFAPRREPEATDQTA